MTAATLARYYDQLTPSERLPLFLAAWARGDTVERRRLAHSDSARLWRVSACWALAEGLDDLVAWYVITQLEIAVDYAALAGRLRCYSFGNQSPKRAYLRGQLREALGILAYQAVLGADAWERVCSDLRVDADAVFGEVVGYRRVKRFIRRARKRAPGLKQALRDLRSLRRTVRSSAEPALPTTPEVEAGMREIIEAAISRWAGAPTRLDADRPASARH